MMNHKRSNLIRRHFSGKFLAITIAANFNQPRRKKAKFNQILYLKL